MATRLEILQGSLVKKQQKFDDMLAHHFATVKLANGQPLNDKRNGAATLRRWDRQDEALRNQLAEIEKTKRAIEREEGKNAETEHVYNTFPQPIKDLIDNGVLVQWRKHPNTLFVCTLPDCRARIQYKKGKLYNKFVSTITEKDTFEVFKKIYNDLHQELAKK